MSLSQKLIKRYRSGGILKVLNEGWRYLLDTLEDKLPNQLGFIIVQVYWLPYLKVLKKSDGLYFLENLFDGQQFWFPQLQHHRRHRQRELQRKRELYYGHNSVSVQKDDVVIDIGAFIGEASLSIADTASHIYAIEPSPRSYKCLENNTKDQNNITTINCAVWEESTEMEFNFADDPTDDTLFAPDTGITVDSTPVEANKLEQIISNCNIDKVDFLKIEAEGAEPEVLRGLGNVPVHKIAVNCDPERDGESTKREVKTILTKMGYSTIEGNDKYYDIVYANKSEGC